LIENEEGNSEGLLKNLEEVSKSNIKTKQDIHELKALNKVARNRFQNIEAVQFLAREKSTVSSKNLKTIKSELKEMEEMRNKFRTK